MESKKIASLKDLFSFFRECRTFNSPIFRGHHKKEFQLESSAVRRLKNSFKVKPSNKAIIDYHVETLIENAKKMHYHYRESGSIVSDLELLVELQHQGAATSLLDFTKNLCVALWFACNDFENDGAVFFIEDSTNIGIFQRATLNVLRKSVREIFEDTRIKLYIWEPPGLRTRILQQDSIFIFGLNEEILSRNAKKIVIYNKIKRDILELLEKVFNVGLNTLFKDFDGFALANSQNESLATSMSTKLFLQGNEYFQEQNYKKAIESYKKAIEIDPKFSEVYLHLGILYLNLGEHQRAVDIHRKAIKIDPSNDRANYNLRIIQSIQKKTANIEIDHSPKNYCSLGIELVKMEDYDKAIMNYERALEIDPNFYEAYFRLGIAYTKLKEYDKAIENYQYCIKTKPNDYKTYASLSIAYEEIGEYEKSIEYKNKSKEIKKAK